MAQFLLIGFIFAQLLIGLAIATQSKAEPPVSRKLGVQHVPAPSQSPSSNGAHNDVAISLNESSSSVNLRVDKSTKHRHTILDKSVVGGGVIFGGLVTAFVVSIFRYIRATARHKTESIIVV
ncbi:hypothetical protein ACFE04_001296 [Oxalis oulophora]